MEENVTGKQKTISRMVHAVLKRNRMQAAALAVTYVLIFSLLVMLAFFYPSIEKTFDRYLEEYRLPQGTILTETLPKSEVQKALQEEEGISAMSLRIVLDAQTQFPNGKTISCRYHSVPEADEARYYSILEKEDVKPNNNSVMVSSYFASQNDVKPGDRLSVSTFFGWKEIIVTDIISSPETICTNRDAFTWYDSSDFAYLFVGEALMEELFACGGYCNRVDLWFQNGADAAQAVANAEIRLGQAVLYAGTYEGSDTQKQIQSSLDSTRAVVTYMPVLLIGICILFSTLFFIQIVNRGEKQNGLMMAIGFDYRQISVIYVRCALRLTLCSAAAGFLLGAALLRFILQIYVGTYDLPFLSYDGSPLLLPLLFLIIIAAGVVSSLVSCLRLVKLDPVRIFSAGGSDQKNLPGWISRLKISSFSKMSLCNIYRNRRRFWLSVFCGMACLILTFLSISVMASKNESIKYLFEERFLYDVAIRCTDEGALREIASLPGVEQYELIREMSFEYEDETLIVDALPDAPELIGIQSVSGEKLTLPPMGGILLEEGFARRHHLAIGDQLILEDTALTVNGIVREYYNSIQYISFETSAVLSGAESNTVLVVLDPEISVPVFIAAACETDGYLYYFSRESRQECVKSILSTLDYPCYVFSLFSVIVGAVIVSTMNLVTIAQRRKKYAALYVLGTSLQDFLRIELPEVALQFIATVILGCIPAILCAKFMLRQMSAPSQEYVLVHPLLITCISAAVVAFYLFIGVLVTISAIRNMDYLEILSER